MERQSRDQRPPPPPEVKRTRTLSPLWKDRKRSPSIQRLGRLTHFSSARSRDHQRTVQVESDLVSPPSSPDP